MLTKNCSEAPYLTHQIDKNLKIRHTLCTRGWIKMHFHPLRVGVQNGTTLIEGNTVKISKVFKNGDGYVNWVDCGNLFTIYTYAKILCCVHSYIQYSFVNHTSISWGDFSNAFNLCSSKSTSRNLAYKIIPKGHMWYSL